MSTWSRLPRKICAGSTGTAEKFGPKAQLRGAAST
jgi:hypothetical protein